MHTRIMINSLTIKNFQSWKKAVFRFHKEVNVIVGETDAGKSAIIKALRLVINNKPSGDEFISYWDSSTQVKAKVGRKIAKRVKGNKNLYYINKNKFKSFGQSVPEQVSKLFNISNVNIQHQLDMPFLLSESPGEVARYFNKIVNLDIIDRSLKNASDRIRKETRELSTKKDQRDSLKKSLKKYDWLVDAEDKLRKLEQTQRSINKINKQIDKISTLITDIEELKLDRTKFARLIKAKPKVYKLIKLAEEIDKKSSRYDELSELIESIEETGKHIKAKTKEKGRLEKKFNKLMPDICPLCEQEVSHGR